MIPHGFVLFYIYTVKQKSYNQVLFVFFFLLLVLGNFFVYEKPSNATPWNKIYLI